MIIANILTKEKFWIVQVFLNDLIDQSIIDKIQPEMKKLINNFYEIEKFSNLFSKNLEKLTDLVLTILKTGEYDKVKKILNLNAKLIASDTKQCKMFEKFCKFLFDFLKSSDLKDLISHQGIFLEIINSTLSIGIFEIFVENTESKTDREFIKHQLKIAIHDYCKFNIFCSLCGCNNLTKSKVEKFLEITKRFLSFDEMLKMMQNCNIKQYNILMNSYIINENNFKTKWQEIEKFCLAHNGTENFIELVKQKHFNIRNISHEVAHSYDIETHKGFWELLSKTFQNREELKKFALEKRDDNENYFTILVNRNKFSSSFLFEVFKVVQSYFTNAQLKEFLISKNSRNMNILNIVASWNHLSLEVLWKIYQESFELDELLRILTENDALGRNIFNIAAENPSDVFEILINKSEKIFTTDKIRKLLFNIGNFERNLLYSAARNQYLKLHDSLWKTLKKYFKPIEIKEFIKYIDNDGENFLFRAVYDNTKNTLDITWNEIKNIMNHDEQIEYLKTKSNGKDLVEKNFKNKFHKEEAYEWVKEQMIEYKFYKYNQNNQFIKF